MTLGSFFLFIMKDFEVRSWVHDSVKSFFKGELKENEKYNIKLIYDCEDGESTVYVRQWVNCKWELIEWFETKKYYKNYWDEITDPWVCDFVGDITKKVIEFIQEPKKRGL